MYTGGPVSDLYRKTGAGPIQEDRSGTNTGRGGVGCVEGERTVRDLYRERRCRISKRVLVSDNGFRGKSVCVLLVFRRPCW